MIDAETELKIYKSANHPTADTGNAGGAISAGPTEITGSAAGEFLTRLRAQASGTIDDSGDIEKQYQKAFWKNLSSTSDLLDGIMYIKNGEKRPAAPGTARWAPTHVDDNDDKKMKVWGKLTSTGLLDTEEIIGPASPGEVAGAKTWDFIIRRQLLNVADDTQAFAAADIPLKVGTEVTGVMPGPPPWGGTGCGWATEEIQMWVVSTTGDSGTSTNRKTAPGGSSFTRAYDVATALSIRNDSGNDTLAAGVAQGFWLQQILQPGMEPAPPTMQIWLVLSGDST